MSSVKTELPFLVAPIDSEKIIGLFMEMFDTPLNNGASALLPHTIDQAMNMRLCNCPGASNHVVPDRHEDCRLPVDDPHRL